MKKVVKNLLFTLVLFGEIFTLTGCNKKEVKKEEKLDNKIIGTWKWKDKGVSSTYVFKKNKKGSYTLTVANHSSSKDFTYKTQEGKLLIKYKNNVSESDYKVNKETLIIKDSDEEEFKYNKQ